MYMYMFLQNRDKTQYDAIRPPSVAVVYDIKVTAVFLLGIRHTKFYGPMSRIYLRKTC